MLISIVKNAPVTTVLFNPFCPTGNNCITVIFYSIKNLNSTNATFSIYMLVDNFDKDFGL